MRICTASSFFLYILLLHGILFAQKPSGKIVDSSLVLLYNISPDSLSVVQPILKRDSTLEGFEQYNPLTKNFSTFVQQGNVGRATHNLLFSPTLSTGFDLDIHSFDYERFNLNSVKYSKVLFPFTEILYVQGGKKEQVFEVYHTQNILKVFQAGADFKLINSSGSYARQKSDVTNLFLYAGYQSKNKQYSNKLTFINNILKIQENGGIKYDTVFTQNVETNRKVIAVNLNNAENRIRDNTYQFYQEIKLWNTDRVDTVPHSWFFKLLPSTIKHFSIYNSESYVYEDLEPGNTFYPFFPNDTNSILDSMHLKHFKNSISITNKLASTTFPFGYRLGIEQSYAESEIGGIITIYKDWGTYLGFLYILPGEINLSGRYNHLFRDHSSSEQTISGEIRKSFLNKTNLTPELSCFFENSVTNPSVFVTQYSSALFNWDNHFSNIKTLRYGVRLRARTIDAGMENIIRSNSIYFQSGTAKPWQLSENLNYSHIWCSLKIHAGSFFFDNKIDYQKINLSDVIHLPSIISQHSFYSDLELIDHALHLQPGFDIFYVSSYYAQSYMPATRIYYEQNSTKLNEQVYVDFFLRFRISRARIFFKYQNFNSLFGNKDYFMTPSYPMQDAGIKFGISWVFRDPPIAAEKDKK